MLINNMAYNQLAQSLLVSRHYLNPSQTLRNILFEQDRSLEMLYRKFNRTLPELKVQKGAKKDRPFICPFIFSPQSRFIIGWQVLNILLIYLYFIQIPIILAFENRSTFDNNERFFRYLNTPAIFIFVCDIFINLNTSLYKEGVFIESPKEIRAIYYRSHFVIDIVSILGIIAYEVLQFTQQFENEKIKLFVLLFFVRFYNLFKMESTMSRSFDLNRRIKAFLKLFLLVVKILLICNAVACSAFYISYKMAKANDSCVGDCFWVKYVTYDGKSLFEYDDQFQIQYVYSLYWASTTMISIGYGDIVPKNPTEVGFTIFVQFLSCLLFGYSINEIWSIIQQLNSKKSKISYRLNIINTYLRDKDVTNELTSKVNAYLNNYYYSRNLRQRQIEAQIISQLTPALRNEIFYQSYSKLFCHRYFQKLDPILIESACIQVKQVGYNESQMIFNENNRFPRLFYVKKGDIQCYLGQFNAFIRKYYHGDIVGIYQFFARLNFKASLKVSSYSLLYSITVSDWRKVLSNSQYEFQRYYFARQELVLYHNGSSVWYRCSLCNSSQHRTEDCLDSQLRRFIIDDQRLSKIQSNKRRSYPRRQLKISSSEKYRRQRKKSHMFNKKEQLKFRSQLEQSRHNRRPQASRKLSLLDDESINKNRKVYIKNQKTRHDNIKAIQKLRKLHSLSELQEFSSIQIGLQDLQFSQIDIDLVNDYEYYYPRYNTKEQFIGDLSRRRFTRRE